VKILAHGVGTRQDLPIPFTYALIGAVVALVVSFVALGLLWQEPRLVGGRAGRALPSAMARLLDSGGFRWALRLLGLVATTWVLAAALFGPDDALNPTAGVVYVLFWVGVLVVASVLFGPVWRALNPLRTLHLLLMRLAGVDPTDGLVRYPPRLGLWPAAIVLFAFVWLELVAPERATLPVLRTWFAMFIAVMVVGSAVFGSRWFDGADGFETYSSLMGRMSVLGRRDDGVLVTRSPLNGLAGIVPVPGLAAVVVVLLGSTAYDGLSNSPWWIARTQSYGEPELTGTLGVIGMIAIVAVTYVGATMLAGRLGAAARSTLPGEFAHSIVPIALGYVVAHYYSLFVVVGQQTLQQLSDPLGTGADYFGIADRGVSYAWVTPTFVATLQVVAVVIGHVLGVVLAHDRAVRLFPRRQALVGQLPLLAVMVFYTLGGLTLLFAA
jgi:hypothetical protein